MRRRTIFDDVEMVMRERLWLPWYERYGPDFREDMFRYPFEQRNPPKPTRIENLNCNNHLHSAVCMSGKDLINLRRTA